MIVSGVPTRVRASTPVWLPSRLTVLFTLPMNSVNVPGPTRIVSPAAAAAVMALAIVPKAFVPKINPGTGPPCAEPAPGFHVTVSPTLSPAGATSVVMEKSPGLST